MSLKKPNDTKGLQEACYLVVVFIVLVFTIVCLSSCKTTEVKSDAIRNKEVFKEIKE